MAMVGITAEGLSGEQEFDNVGYNPSPLPEAVARTAFRGSDFPGGGLSDLKIDNKNRTPVIHQQVDGDEIPHSVERV